MKLDDLKWAASVFMAAALRPAGHDDCTCHPRAHYLGPRCDDAADPTQEGRAMDRAGTAGKAIDR